MNNQTLYMPPKRGDSTNTQSLDKAYMVLSQSFDEYAEANNLSIPLKETIKKVMKEAYIEKKAERFILSKTAAHANYFGNYLNFMLNKFVSGQYGDNHSGKYNAVYVKHLKELVNE